MATLRLLREKPCDRRQPVDFAGVLFSAGLDDAADPPDADEPLLELGDGAADEDESVAVEASFLPAPLPDLE